MNTIDIVSYSAIEATGEESSYGEKVLTTASIITCGHAGTLTLTGETLMTVDSNGVATTNSISSDSVVGCAWINPATQSPSPCTTVKSTSGASTVLKVNGNFVLLKTSTIVVNNADTTTYPSGVTCGILSSGQIKLEA